MEEILKTIDEIMMQLNECAYGRDLPSGHETGCNPAHFASSAKRLFAAIDRINSLSLNFWKDNEYFRVYDCKRLSEHDLTWACEKTCRNSEKIVLSYLEQFGEIVEMIHRNSNIE